MDAKKYFWNQAIQAALLATLSTAALAQTAPDSISATRITLRYPTQKVLYTPHPAPPRSPKANIVCILYDNTPTTENSSHLCKVVGGGGTSNIDGPASTQCGLSCQDGGTVSNTCPGTDNTNPDECGTSTIYNCTADYSGCYPSSQGPNTSGLQDPSTQAIIPDMPSNPDFCSMFGSVLQQNCKLFPAGEAQSACVYAACLEANSCEGAKKTVCSPPLAGKPASSQPAAPNAGCQAQFASNMAYCTTLTSLGAQSSCIITANANLGLCTKIAAAASQPIRVR